MREMKNAFDFFEPWYVCVNTNKQFVWPEGDPRNETEVGPASVKRFTPEDPRPPAEGKPRTVTVQGKKVPGLMMDDAGRFYSRRKEIPLVGLEITYTNEIDPKFWALDSGIHTPLIQAPADERGIHPVKKTRGWFICAKRLWRENLQSVPAWAK